MILRKALVSDWRLLQAIHAACFDRPWSQDALVGSLSCEGAVAFVALEGPGLYCGFVIARVAADEAEILTIAVVEGARGQGMGRGLMMTVEDACRDQGARTLFLEVAADNAAALALYAACGFEAAGRRARYYDRGPTAPRMDAILMRRTLPTRPAKPYLEGR